MDGEPAPCGEEASGEGDFGLGLEREPGAGKAGCAGRRVGCEPAGGLRCRRDGATVASLRAPAASKVGCAAVLCAWRECVPGRKAVRA